jgi:hypothetical protein
MFLKRLHIVIKLERFRRSVSIKSFSTVRQKIWHCFEFSVSNDLHDGRPTDEAELKSVIV